MERWANWPARQSQYYAISFEIYQPENPQAEAGGDTARFESIAEGTRWPLAGNSTKTASCLQLPVPAQRHAALVVCPRPSLSLSHSPSYSVTASAYVKALAQVTGPCANCPKEALREDRRRTRRTPALGVVMTRRPTPTACPATARQPAPAPALALAPALSLALDPSPHHPGPAPAPRLLPPAPAPVHRRHCPSPSPKPASPSPSPAASPRPSPSPASPSPKPADASVTGSVSGKDSTPQTDRSDRRF